MALKNLDVKGMFLKCLFDGYDLIEGDIGKLLITPKLYPYIKQTTYVENIYDNADEFIEYCKWNLNKYPDELLYLDTKELMNKYNVGIYRLGDCSHRSNPWNDKQYILFNSERLQDLYNLYPTLSRDIKFWVCPSYNKRQVESIGFRILNPFDVQTAFKWLFISGNNIIYGKDTVNKDVPCFIVEGFRDYVALKENGYNVIGLGSVEISSKQKEFINTLKTPILLLDNDSFGLKKSLEYNKQYGYGIATLIGTNQKDAWDAWRQDKYIDISCIK